MADGIYVSMNGAAARLAQLDSISDNLANTETPGYKATRPSFEAFLAKSENRQAAKVYPAAVSTQVDLSPGAIVDTGNPLDVLPTGRSFIGVQTSSGVGLTRAGRLQVERDGALTAAGRPVVDRDRKPIITPLGSTLRIDSTGEIFANDTKIAELGLFEASGPVDRVGPSLLLPQDQTSLFRSADQLRIGAMETGNSTPMEAAIQLVSAQRHYDTSMQALQTYRTLDQRAAEVGRVR